MNQHTTAAQQQPDKPPGAAWAPKMQAAGLAITFVMALFGVVTSIRASKRAAQALDFTRRADKRAAVKHEQEQHDRAARAQKAEVEKRATEMQRIGAAAEQTSFELEDELDRAAATLLVDEGKGHINGGRFMLGERIPEVEVSTENIFRRRR